MQEYGSGSPHDLIATKNPAEGRYLLAAATIALLLAGVVMPSPLYNLYRSEFGLTPATISVVFAIYAGALIPSLIFFGGISDTIGRRRTMLMGLVLIGLGSLVFAFADRLVWLIVARIIQGLAIGIGLSASIAAVTEWMVEPARKHAGRLAVVSTSVGAAFGALLAGTLGQYVANGPMLAFLIHIALLVLVSIGIATTPSSPHVHPAHSSVVSVPPPIRRAFTLVAVQTFIGWGTLAMFMSLVPTFLDTRLNLRNLMAGTIVIVVIQLSVVATSLVGERLNNRLAIIAGMLALGGGVWSLLLSALLQSKTLIGVAAVLVGAGFGLSYLAGLRIIEDIAPPEHLGEVTSAFLVACYLGFSVPVLAVGIAADSIGLLQAFIAAAVLLGVIALAIIAFARDRYLKAQAL